MTRVDSLVVSRGEVLLADEGDGGRSRGGEDGDNVNAGEDPVRAVGEGPVQDEDGGGSAGGDLKSALMREESARNDTLRHQKFVFFGRHAGGGRTPSY